MLNSIKSYYLTAFLIFAFSCTEQTKTITTRQEEAYSNNYPEIIRVSVTKEGCFGPCPNETFEVDTSLKVLHYGGLNADLWDSTRKGYHAGRASSQQWRQICELIRQINLTMFSNKYLGNEDLDGREIAIVFNNSKMVIRGKTDSLPKQLLSTCDSIFNILNGVPLTKIRGPVALETGTRIR